MRYFLVFISAFMLSSCLTQRIPVAKGERILSVDVNESQDTLYDAAIDKVMALGVHEVPLFFNWNTIETSPNTFDATLFDIANIYYPKKNLKLILTITPIHTNVNVTPSDLQDKPLNDPEVIKRFEQLLEFVFAKLPDVELSSLVIGSEMDVYFGEDRNVWQQYLKFFTEVSSYLHSRKPELDVVAETTFTGLINPKNREVLQALYPEGSYVGVSYYPLNSDFSVRDPAVVSDDFKKLHNLFPNHIFLVYQIGYPSSPENGSSELKQSRFIREVFKAWDQHAETMPLIIFSWLHDVPPETLRSFEDFYGLSDNGFLAFLASLGLRTYETPSQDKMAFEVLREEAKLRGW